MKSTPIDTNTSPSPATMETLGTAPGGGGRQISPALRSLANWLLLRSVGDHDYQTTLTMLERKVKQMRRRNFSHDTVTKHDLSPPRSPSTDAGL